MRQMRIAHWLKRVIGVVGLVGLRHLEDLYAANTGVLTAFDLRTFCSDTLLSALPRPRTRTRLPYQIGDTIATL